LSNQLAPDRVARQVVHRKKPLAQATCKTPTQTHTTGRRAARRKSTGARAIATDWREITNDPCAKDVFIRIMERMDNRYIGLGAPSGPLKVPLDQWIDQHVDPGSPRGAGL
jgi:hypothetical protein